jgi:hypothetical protein
MGAVETILRVWGGGKVKKQDTGEWIELWYIVRTFVNVTMTPEYNYNMIIN